MVMINKLIELFYVNIFERTFIVYVYTYIQTSVSHNGT